MKIFVESDLVIIRSFPGSFYHPVILDTPSDHISEKIQCFLGYKRLLLYPKNNCFFSSIWSEGYQKSPDDKNSPEMNELERDINPQKFS